MFSGGPDSALCLKEATETNEPVIAVHVNFIGSEREFYEQSACRKIVNHHFPDVTYREYDINLEFLRYRDYLILAPFAGAVCATYPTIDTFWTGEDLNLDSANQQMNRFLAQQFTIAVDNIVKSVNPQDSRQWIFMPPVDKYRSKQQIRNLLGEDLWNMTWSCRIPVNDQPCHQCHSCKQRENTNAT